MITVGQIRIVKNSIFYDDNTLVLVIKEPGVGSDMYMLFSSDSRLRFDIKNSAWIIDKTEVVCDV